MFLAYPGRSQELVQLTGSDHLCEGNPCTNCGLPVHAAYLTDILPGKKNNKKQNKTDFSAGKEDSTTCLKDFYMA